MRILIFYILFLLSASAFSQNLKLDREGTPAYVIANQTDTLGILFSVNDVQKIDHNLEVLEYLEKLSKEVDTTQFYYVSLIEQLEEKVEIQKYRIINLTSESFKQSELVFKLKKDITLANKIIDNRDEEINNQLEIIEQKDKEIKKQKTIKTIAIIGGITLTILALVFG